MCISRISFLVICFLLVSCDSQFEIKVGDEQKVNQICVTDIYGDGDRYWDTSYVQKDCRKGEILTTNVVLYNEESIFDIRDYEHRLNYLVSKICDFDKQIVVQKVPHDLQPNLEFVHAYDLSCVYSGGFNFPGEKWIEEMKDKE